MITSIAIGAFDGVHLAHKVLIDSVDAIAIIERNSGVLTPGYVRTRYIDKPSFFYHFDKIRELSAEAFLLRLKEDFPSLAKIVVGYDFHFGKGKSGDVKLLEKLFDGEVTVVEPIKSDGIAVHSRVIKDLIKNSEIQKANILLGRSYQICGEVISGQGIGGKELVPTLNIDSKDYLLPKDGIYATNTKIGDIWYKSVSFIGHRVSTDGKFAIETHIIDKEIHGVNGSIEISFESFIRENRKFDDFGELKRQIEDDILKAKEII
ncbi:MAG: bifunctional riboflavin kinase/FAD synthetase [Campylobacterales bacterium]|nr:bifunctional riboflavin kinase/FAD synthetase [Campylobacterales bacterium]